MFQIGLRTTIRTPLRSSILIRKNTGAINILSLRLKSNIPSSPSQPSSPKKSNNNYNQVSNPNSPAPKNLPSQQEWENLKLHIPGETVQTNKLKDRVPMWPLSKENVPTLLPRPGIPQVGKNYTFKQVIKILQNKKQPELIYESEPHKLYFLLCFCLSIVFAVYACVLLEWAFWISNKEFDDNEKEETNMAIRNRNWALSLGLYLCPSIIMFAAAYGAIIFPTKLIRRMWYLPGPKEFIKFSTYPLIPGRPTPVYTVPLTNLSRRKTARVWTGKGFYGTADKGFFFFVLQEKISALKSKTWIVDRKAFFWSDGRVFDYLFGKETIKESEAGIPYDKQIEIINKNLKLKKQKMKQKHGSFWHYKLAFGMFKDDLKKVGNFVTGKKTISNEKGNDKQLPKD
ncbi:hypothetical protein KGF54_002832 [Candida jiufengensis]|uniref:uncharacterized protein n=1 Tax=Candida jiufengensis TaxID=497108 RepID=UPI002223EECA|nr:uncharacterized protein KGF54_002832 [Candida jiufengensis]KAI5953460.1 hypothetical protein KGF54_002832 [Candida jiufengensis]